MMRFTIVLDMASSPRDTTESKVAGGSVDRLGVARRRAVAPAIVRRAQVRAALDDLARNPDVRQAGIAACILAAAARIFRNAARFADHQSLVHSQTLPIMS